MRRFWSARISGWSRPSSRRARSRSKTRAFRGAFCRAPPRASSMSAPNASTTRASPSLPGSTTSRASTSASTTGTPRSRSLATTRALARGKPSGQAEDVHGRSVPPRWSPNGPIRLALPCASVQMVPVLRAAIAPRRSHPIRGPRARASGRALARPRRGRTPAALVVSRRRAAFGAPGVGADGSLAVGTVDGYVHALRADGIFRYSYTVDGRVHGSPVVLGDGLVVVASDKSGLYAIKPDGSLAWETYIAGGVDLATRRWTRRSGSGFAPAPARHRGLAPWRHRRVSRRSVAR